MKIRSVTPPLLPEGERIVPVPPEEFHNVLDVLETAFPNTPRTLFSTLTLQDPWRQTKFSLAVVKGKRYLAHIQIFDRSIYIDGVSVRIGGVGSVGSRPECRGKGYPTALLRYGMDLMEEEGMGGSMLYTSIHPFYERLGWKTVNQYEQNIPVKKILRYIPKPIRHRSLRENDYLYLQEIYGKNHARISGLMRRTPDYWRARSIWMGHIPTVIERDGKPAAYFYAMQYNEKKPILTISEYGFSNPDEETLTQLLGTMARKAEETNCLSLRGFFRHNPDFGLFLDARDLIENESEHNYVMWKDIGAHKFDRRIQELASQRRWLYWTTDAF
ncbi:MAG: GNAT family N-acetyltransferase [Candidatus Omnitrophota bacterium]